MLRFLRLLLMLCFLVCRLVWNCGLSVIGLVVFKLVFVLLVKNMLSVV